MKMCYVGKATKIFIFVVTVLVATGLVLGFGLLRYHTHQTHKCSADSCPQSSPVFPNPIAPPYQIPGSNTAQPPPPPVVAAAPPPILTPPSPVFTPGPVQRRLIQV
ncbi:hypothetical protein NMG60_11003077 [Bertholletia excelsa]